MKQNRLVSKTICLLLGVIINGSLLSQTKDKANFFVKNYTLHDGLPQMQVNAIKFSKDKTAWIGTRAGISKFNGISFDNFEEIDLKPDYVHDLEETKNGDIAILNHQGVYLFDGSTFTLLDYPDSLQYKAEYDRLFVDWEDRLWINNRRKRRCIVYEKGVFKSANEVDELSDIEQIKYVIPNNCQEKLCVVAKQGHLLEVSKKEKKTISNTVHVLSLPRNTKQNHHCEKNRNSLVYLRDKYKDDLSIIDVRIDGSVDTLLKNETFLKQQKKGETISLLLDDKLVEYKGNEPKTIINNIEAKYNYYHSSDSSDDLILIGTDKGLIEVRESPFYHFSEETHQNIWTVNQTKEKEMIFGSWGRGITTDHKELTSIVLDKKSTDCNANQWENSNKYIYMGSTKTNGGDLLFPTGVGISMYKDGKVSSFYEDEHCDQNNPQLFVYNDGKNIFSAACPGVKVLDQSGKLIRTIDSSLFDHKCILTITKDSSGKYWFGGRNGVASYDYAKNEVINYEYDQGKLPLKVAICSFVDHKGNVWFGGVNGLVRYDANTDGFLMMESFEHTQINAIHQSSKNQCFLASLDGIIMLDLESYYKDDELIYQLFNEQYGYYGIEPGQNGFFQDKDDHIWITSSTQLACFDPQKLVYTSEERKVIISKVNGKRIGANTKNIRLERGANDVLIDYGIGGFHKDQLIVYRNKLNDGAWTQWEAVNNSRFQDLGGRKYHFSVQAKLPGQQKHISEASLEFYVDIPFHQGPYFANYALLLSLAFLGISVLFYRNNLLHKRINKLLESEKQELIFKTSELEGINKDLQRKLEAKITSQKSTIGDKLEIKVNDKILLLNKSDILYILAEDNGSRIVSRNKSIWTLTSLKEFESKLDQDLFVRIHRGTIINISEIEWIHQNNIQMKDGKECRIGRTYKKSILQIMS